GAPLAGRPRACGRAAGVWPPIRRVLPAVRGDPAGEAAAALGQGVAREAILLLSPPSRPPAPEPGRAVGDAEWRTEGGPEAIAARGPPRRPGPCATRRRF